MRRFGPRSPDHHDYRYVEKYDDEQLPGGRYQLGVPFSELLQLVRSSRTSSAGVEKGNALEIALQQQTILDQLQKTFFESVINGFSFAVDQLAFFRGFSPDSFFWTSFTTREKNMVQKFRRDGFLKIEHWDPLPSMKRVTNDR
ncbi:unnamed protein product [Amoebophrya sp. A25]|nr:unnamed protein product [Amoebophrya sp. A25]|eukprot:GSA25T00015436001.1